MMVNHKRLQTPRTYVNEGGLHNTWSDLVERDPGDTCHYMRTKYPCLLLSNQCPTGPSTARCVGTNPFRDYMLTMLHVLKELIYRFVFSFKGVTNMRWTYAWMIITSSESGYKATKTCWTTVTDQRFLLVVIRTQSLPYPSRCQAVFVYMPHSPGSRTLHDQPREVNHRLITSPRLCEGYEIILCSTRDCNVKRTIMRITRMYIIIRDMTVIMLCDICSDVLNFYNSKRVVSSLMCIPMQLNCVYKCEALQLPRLNELQWLVGTTYVVVYVVRRLSSG